MSLPPATNCPDCCYEACYAPTLVWRSRSASKSKNGWNGTYDAGAVVRPMFKRMGWTGSLTVEVTSGEGEEACQSYIECTYSGENTYDIETGVVTVGMSVRSHQYGCAVTEIDNTYDFSVILDRTPYDPFYWSQCWNYSLGVPTRTYAATSATLEAPLIDYFSGTPKPTGPEYWTLTEDSTATMTVDDEFTDSELMEQVIAALPEDYPNTTGGAYLNFTPNRRSYSIREPEFSFRFRIPEKAGGVLGTKYYIRWDQVFTPLYGGSSVVESKCLSWNGVKPTGYDPDDSNTWPQINASGAAGWTKIPIPGGNDPESPPDSNDSGTVTITNITYSCDPADAC